MVLSLTSCDSFLDIQPVGKVIPNTLEEYRALITTAYGVDLTDRGMCDMRTEDISVSKDELIKITSKTLKDGLQVIHPEQSLAGAITTKIFIMPMLSSTRKMR